MDVNSISKIAIVLMIGISSLVWAWSQKHNFELIQLGELARNQFLIDRKAGRVWQKVCDGENNASGGCEGMLIWEEMYIGGFTPSDSEPALIYSYILRQREEANLEKDKSKK